MVPYAQIMLAGAPVDSAGKIRVHWDNSLKALFFTNPQNDFHRGWAFAATSFPVEAFETVVEGGKRKGLPIMSAVNPCTVEQSQKLSNMGIKFQLFGADLGLISATFHDLMQNVVSKVR